MELLHVTNGIIIRPDIIKYQSKNYFGKGFYITPNWNRAWEMGLWRVDFYGGEIMVNAYNFDLKAAKDTGLWVMCFEGFTIELVRFFVIQNREVSFFSHGYDIVISPVSDAILDAVLYAHKIEYGDRYLKDGSLQKFIGKVSHFLKQLYSILFLL